MLFGCGNSADKRAAEVDKKLEGKKLETTAAQAPNDLPNMTIWFLDGSQTNAKKLEGKTILIFYFPDCDHCQREATQIQKNIDRFKDHTLYFITVAPKPEAEKFAKDYKLNDVQNVKFGFVTANDVITNLGNIDTPALYIYSQEHKLVKEFIGENDINLILKYVI